MTAFSFIPSHTTLLIVDMQEKLFPTVERGSEILFTLSKLVKAFQLLGLPIAFSEQYPEGLGKTIFPLRSLFGEVYPWKKTTFSCLDNSEFLNFVLSHPYSQWIVTGIEAHICVLQTVKGLLNLGKQVAVLNDATSSRSIYDFSTAIAEMRDGGARITSSETILFELIKDSKHPKFKEISALIKECGCC